jgi:hypothetical protein
MPGQHTEHTFETVIEHHLSTAGGYIEGTTTSFSERN